MPTDSELELDFEPEKEKGDPPGEILATQLPVDTDQLMVGFVPMDTYFVPEAYALEIVCKVKQIIKRNKIKYFLIYRVQCTLY